MYIPWKQWNITGQYHDNNEMLQVSPLWDMIMADIRQNVEGYIMFHNGNAWDLIKDAKNFDVNDEYYSTIVDVIVQATARTFNFNIYIIGVARMRQ